MTFAFPLALGLGAVAALATIALHVIAWRRPEPRMLPTARFLPRRTAASRVLRLAPRDLALLVLRLLAVTSIALAVAGPLVRWGRGGIVRVVVAERSRAVADAREVADSVRAVSQGATDAPIVIADSVPGRGVGEAPGAAPPTHGASPLGAALVLAIREGAARRARGDSVELVLVTPFVQGGVDESVPELVRAWGRPVRLVRVRAATVERIPAPTGASLPDATDAVAAAAWRAWGMVPAHLRLVRGTPGAADSAFARAGGTLVAWPVDTSTAGGGLVAGSAVAVGPWGRVAAAPGGTPVARWHDGAVAAAESSLGAGCVREVRVGTPTRGDATLRPAFVAVVRTLTAPCPAPDLAAADPSLLQPGPGPAEALPVPPVPDARLQRLLLLLGALALGVEHWARRRTGSPALRDAAPPVREAA